MTNNVIGKVSKSFTLTWGGSEKENAFIAKTPQGFEIIKGNADSDLKKGFESEFYSIKNFYSSMSGLSGASSLRAKHPEVKFIEVGTYRCDIPHGDHFKRNIRVPINGNSFCYVPVGSGPVGSGPVGSGENNESYPIIFSEARKDDFSEVIQIEKKINSCCLNYFISDISDIQDAIKMFIEMKENYLKCDKNGFHFLFERKTLPYVYLDPYRQEYISERERIIISVKIFTSKYRNVKWRDPFNFDYASYVESSNMCQAHNAYNADYKFKSNAQWSNSLDSKNSTSYEYVLKYFGYRLFESFDTICLAKIGKYGQIEKAWDMNDLKESEYQSFFKSITVDHAHASKKIEGLFYYKRVATSRKRLYVINVSDILKNIDDEQEREKMYNHYYSEEKFISFYEYEYIEFDNDFFMSELDIEVMVFNQIVSKFKNDIENLIESKISNLNNEDIIKILSEKNPVFTVQDSYRVGNCKIGTERFLQKFKIKVPENGEIRFKDLMNLEGFKNMLEDSQFLRVLKKKIRDENLYQKE